MVPQYRGGKGVINIYFGCRENLFNKIFWVTKFAYYGVQKLNLEFKLIGLQTRKARKHDPDKTDLFLYHEKRKSEEHFYLWACVRVG